LSELVGSKGLVLYFYPRDNTPGCTQEACDFRDNFNLLKKAGYNVIGISKDSPKSHQKFTEKQSLNFDLIADESGEICEKYGVWQLKKFMGKESMGIVRTTFLLDEKLKILKIYNKVSVKGHVAQILEDIKGLSK
ncbi:MAG: peroxiredoxin, partial [Leptospiraceae bacterium]|nr:peroxiredoxin [Leptospiraceae bacterium]